MGGGRFGGDRVEGAQGSSGYQPGRPHSSKKEPLKFDDDYDFEQANEQFQEFCSKFEKANLEGRNGEPDEEHHPEVEEGDVAAEPDGDKPVEQYYDKRKSFFDNISCESLERSKGNMSKPDWKAEKKLNRETFGAAGNFGGGRGRGGYYNRGGGYYGGRGGYNRGRGGGGSGNGYYGGGGGGNRGSYGGSNGGYNNGYNRYQRDGVSTGGYRGGGGRGGPRGGGGF
jgi:protein LSM14